MKIKSEMDAKRLNGENYDIFSKCHHLTMTKSSTFPKLVSGVQFLRHDSIAVTEIQKQPPRVVL